MRYAPALGSHFCQTLSAAVVCPSLDISTELTPHRIITGLSRPALRAHLTTGDEGLDVQGNPGSEPWSRPVTYESWTGDCKATRSGPISLMETRGNGYVFSDTLLKKNHHGSMLCPRLRTLPPISAFILPMCIQHVKSTGIYGTLWVGYKTKCVCVHMK